DGTLLGAGSVRAAAHWLHHLGFVELDDTALREKIRAELATRRWLPGFGVPARKVDERVTAMCRCIASRGRDQLSHWTLWSKIVDETRRHGLEPNVGSAFSAALLDLGFRPADAPVVVHLCVLPCYLANAVEGVEQQPELFR